MAITNGSTWLAEMVGDTSGKIEGFCLDVEEVICMDTVNYVESKLKQEGANGRSFWLEFMQEVFTSSKEQASEEILSDMPPLESSDSDVTFDTAEGDSLKEESCSINNYSDVDSKSYGDSTQHVPISQAEATPLKSEDGHEGASLPERLGEDFNGLDTSADNISTVKSLCCVSPEEHVSIIPDVTSSNEFVEEIGSDWSIAQELNESIKLDESCIIVDAKEVCLAPNEMTEQLIQSTLSQNQVLENMASTTRNYDFDESEWEII